MLQLTAQQKDALSELINIGFGRAANSLSIMSGNRVQIEAPRVDLYPLHDLPEALALFSTESITSLNQVFTGRIRGIAMLLMNSTSTGTLVNLLDGKPGAQAALSEANIDTLIEVGNILLSSFTGSFGNLLMVQVSFTVPSLRFNSLQNMLASLTIEHRELEYALVVHVSFQLLNHNVRGYLVIVMGIQSLEALLEAMQSQGFS